MPLCRGLSTGLELVVLEKSPKTQSKCTQKGKIGTIVAGEMSKQHARLYNQHFFIILVILEFRKGLGLKKKTHHPSSNNGYNHTLERKN